MFKINQTGTARDGQRGIITEVYPNAVRFLSDTGAHFTLLNCELTPTCERARRAKAFFKSILPGNGFHFSTRKHRGRTWKQVEGGLIRNIPGYLGIPDGEPAT